MKLKELFEAASQHLAFVGICLIVIIGTFLIAKLAEKLISIKNDPAIRTRKIAVIGIFSAIAGILMFFEFPMLWIAPEFYKMDFSEVPILICAFAYGPVAGVVAELCKEFIKLFLKGTPTAFVGDLANFIFGCAMILPASIIYHIKKTRKGALIGMTTGTIFRSIFGGLFNAVYLIPAYVVLYGMPLEAIVGMGTAVNPQITNVTTLALFAVVPFNILKGTMISIATFLLYKKLSPVIHAQHNIKKKNVASSTETKNL